MPESSEPADGEVERLRGLLTEVYRAGHGIFVHAPRTTVHETAAYDRWQAVEDRMAGRWIADESGAAASPSLTVESVAASVAAIEAAGDNEEAHIAEDAMYVAVLGEVAAGHADPVGLAVAALEASKLDYDRWYA